MAKTKVVSRGRGAVSKEEHIAQLKSLVGREGVSQAEHIVQEYEPNVVRLAFKMLPKTLQIRTNLGARINGLLTFVSQSEADSVRDTLIRAKQLAMQNTNGVSTKRRSGSAR